MNSAVLTQPGRLKMTALSHRLVVLAAIASLHALILYVWICAAQGYSSRLDAPVIHAEVLPVVRRMPDPPSLPPIEFQATIPVDVAPAPITIDLPVEHAQPSPAAITPHQPDLSRLPVVAKMPPVVDTIPVTRPRPIAGPQGVNRYPSASLQAKESGTVVMNICVSAQGKVASVELAQSSGFPRLDQAALSMATEYRFQPATRGGRPVPACAHYNIIFKVT